MLAWMFDPSLIEPTTIRPLSRKEYDRMVDLGFFDEDEHVELLEGVLVQMSPHGGQHAAIVQRLTKELALAIDVSLAVRTQLPLAAGDFSEPEPDIAVVRDMGRSCEHPTEAFLVIEVTGPKNKHDRITKLAIYAKARVPEYWIVHVPTMTVEVYTQPSGKRYKRKQVLRDGDILRPTKLRGVTTAVADLPR